MMAAAKEEKRVMMISLMNDDEGMKSSEYNTGRISNSDTEYILTSAARAAFNCPLGRVAALSPSFQQSLFLNDAVLAADAADSLPTWKVPGV